MDFYLSCYTASHHRDFRLTQAQYRVLKTLSSSTVELGYPPTVRELTAVLGLRSHTNIHAHLEALVGKGYVSHRPGVPRSWRLTRRAQALLNESELRAA